MGDVVRKYAAVLYWITVAANECEGVTCSGKLVCYDFLKGYKCLCPRGSTGEDCEKSKLVHVLFVNGNYEAELHN
jgi:hypothetical protein